MLIRIRDRVGEKIRPLFFLRFGITFENTVITTGRSTKIILQEIGLYSKVSGNSRLAIFYSKK